MDLNKIGKKLKNLRKVNGLTLDELASRSELSKGFLSQLERGQMSPSLDNLNYILESLGTSLSDFFTEDKIEDIVFEDKYLSISKKNDVLMKWLIPTSQGHKMEPIEIILYNNTIFDIEPFDGEMFGKVLEGNCQLIIGTKEWIITTNHTFNTTGDKPIKFISKEKCKILLVSTPPIF